MSLLDSGIEAVTVAEVSDSAVESMLGPVINVVSVYSVVYLTYITE